MLVVWILFWYSDDSFFVISTLMTCWTVVSYNILYRLGCKKEKKLQITDVILRYRAEYYYGCCVFTIFYRDFACLIFGKLIKGSFEKWKSLFNKWNTLVNTITTTSGLCNFYKFRFLSSSTIKVRLVVLLLLLFFLIW